MEALDCLDFCSHWCHLRSWSLAMSSLQAGQMYPWPGELGAVLQLGSRVEEECRCLWSESRDDPGLEVRNVSVVMKAWLILEVVH